MGALIMFILRITKLRRKAIKQFFEESRMPLLTWINLNNISNNLSNLFSDFYL